MLTRPPKKAFQCALVSALGLLLSACASHVNSTLPALFGYAGVNTTMTLPVSNAKPFVNLGSVTTSGINNVSTVVGTHASGSTQHAFLYNGSFIDLGALGGSTFSSTGSGISNVAFGHGAMATGQSQNSAGQGEAFFWNGSSMVARGGATTWGNGIDSVGDIAGRVSSGALAYAIVWLANGTILHPIDTSIISGANAIAAGPSGSTLVTGFQIPGSVAEGFYYDYPSGGVQAIPPLSGDTTLVPRAINSAALIVGDSRNGSVFHAFAAQGGLNFTNVELPTLGGAQAAATSVNKFGVIAGWAQNAAGQDHAVIWRPHIFNGAKVYNVYDVNQLAPTGWTLGSVTGINDNYQLTGGAASGTTNASFILPLNESAIDVGKYAGAISLSQYLKLTSVNSLLKLVVVSVWQPSGASNPSENAQLDNATQAHFDTGAYVFLNYTSSGTTQMSKAISALGGPSATRVQNLRFIAIDVENSAYDGSSSGVTGAARVAIIRAAVAAAPSGKQIVIYTTSGHWASLTGTTAATNPFAKCALWDAQPDTLPDLAEQWKAMTVSGLPGSNQLVQWTPYGGWSSRLGKQYEFNTGADAQAIQTYTTIPSVDLDAFDWKLSTSTNCIGGASL